MTGDEREVTGGAADAPAPPAEAKAKLRRAFVVLVAAIIAFLGFLILAFSDCYEAQALAAYMLTVVGGALGFFGEWRGTLFGARPNGGGSAGAVSRALAFLFLALAGILFGIKDATEAVSDDETLGDIFAAAAAFVLIAACGYGAYLGTGIPADNARAKARERRANRP